MEDNDRLLMELAQRSKGIEPMLDAVFSFLKRKTDLYVEQGPGDCVGFPPGKAREIVMKSFNKFTSAGCPAPDKKALEAMGTRLQGDGRPTSNAGAKMLQPAAPKPPATQALPSQSDPVSTTTTTTTTTSSSSSAAAAASPSPFPTSSLPHYNGAALDAYAWSQTLTDATISLPISPPCSAKSLVVTIEKSHVCIERCDASASPSLVLRGDLPHTINASESLWNLDGGVLVGCSALVCS
jgi:hypothetical protein